MTDIRPTETEVPTAKKPEIDRQAIREMVSKWTPEERRAILKAFNRLPGQEPKVDVQEQANAVVAAADAKPPSALNEGQRPVDTTVQEIAGRQIYTGQVKKEKPSPVPKPDPGAIPIRRITPLPDPDSISVVKYDPRPVPIPRLTPVAPIPKSERVLTPIQNLLIGTSPAEREKMYQKVENTNIKILADLKEGDVVMDDEHNIFTIHRGEGFGNIVFENVDSGAEHTLAQIRTLKDKKVYHPLKSPRRSLAELVREVRD